MGNVLQNTGGNTLKVLAGGGYGSVGDAVASWQLASTNYTTSMGIPLSFVNTQADADCGIVASHRNAYPSVKYNHVVGVHGGAAPYKIELTTKPAGMTIVETLVTSGDTQIGWEDLGRITWDTPTTDSHSVAVLVTDQAGTQITTTFTLVVGTANWVFLDPASGTNGVGSLADPFNTLSALETGHTNKLCYVRAGIVDINLVNDSSNNFRFEAGSVNSIIGYPAEAVSFAQKSGWFVLGGLDDLTLQNFTMYHDATIVAGNDRKCISQVSGSRHNFVDINVTNYVYGTSTANNGAVFTSLGSGAINNGQFLHNWDVTGEAGTVVQLFQWNNGLISCVNVHDANLANPDASSNGGVIKLKDGWIDTTIRANNIWDNNTWNGNQACFDFAGQDQSALGIDGTDICYNRFERPLGGTIQLVPVRMFTHGQAPTSLNTHLYRNSVKAATGAQCIWYNTGGVPTTANSAQLDNNTLQNSDLSTFTEGCWNNADNSTGTSTYFDTNLNLVDRVTYLGKRAAEVSA